MKDITKKYDSGEITAVWQLGLCAPSARWLGDFLWYSIRGIKTIDKSGAADQETIINQADHCPPGT
ncbi:MAG: hypothetical protein JWP78_3800 [Mucilaginibacter sp.]|nr:hypothetical protein [Mucilaginibacter sp.]